MASIILPLAISGSRKADGTVNAGGRVYLSLIDSPNSSVTGYIDRDKSAAATLSGGGYVLDAAGKIALFIDTACRVRIEDASGAAVDSYTYEPTTNEGLVEVDSTGYTGVDPTSGALVAGGRTNLATVLSSLYSSTGGLDGKYRGTYGTADTNIKTEIEQIGLTPQRFGAVGNGVADDTAALQAMASAMSASGLPGFLPRGTYKISSVVTFGASAVLSGVGNSSTLGSVISQSNTGAGGIILGASSIVSNILMTAPSGSSGIGISIPSIGARLVNVQFTFSGTFASGITCNGTVYLLQGCIVNATTTAFAGTGLYYLDFTSSYGSGTVTANKVLFASACGYDTQDVANAGSGVPNVSGLTDLYVRFRGTTAAGTGTIGAPSNVSTIRSTRLVMEFQATGGGTFTFNMNAIFHGTAATTGAITAAQRQVWTYSYNPLDAVWVLQSLTATFA
jgi:hypothetical protein